MATWPRDSSAARSVMRKTVVGALRWTVALCVLAVVVGCGSKPEGTAQTAPSEGVSPPPGVTLSEGGADLVVGESATVMYQIADQATSAITVTVTKIQQGDIKDFRLFSLDEASRAATPYYVSATVRNEGPSGLGGAAVPLYAHDSSNTIMPPNDIVGEFAPCPNRDLPASLLRGEEAEVCLVYLIADGATLVSIDLQTTELETPISWTT